MNENSRVRHVAMPCDVCDVVGGAQATKYFVWAIFDGAVPGIVPPPEGEAVVAPLPTPPAPSPTPILTQTFEFRLAGPEREEQRTEVIGINPARATVAANNVRTYLARSADGSDAGTAIGGVEVWAELRDGALVCGARLSDFGSGDLVVVQVDVAVFGLDG